MFFSFWSILATVILAFTLAPIEETSASCCCCPCCCNCCCCRPCCCCCCKPCCCCCCKPCCCCCCKPCCCCCCCKPCCCGCSGYGRRRRCGNSVVPSPLPINCANMLRDNAFGRQCDSPQNCAKCNNNMTGCTNPQNDAPSQIGKTQAVGPKMAGTNCERCPTNYGGCVMHSPPKAEATVNAAGVLTRPAASRLGTSNQSIMSNPLNDCACQPEKTVSNNAMTNNANLKYRFNRLK